MLFGFFRLGQIPKCNLCATQMGAHAHERRARTARRRNSLFIATDSDSGGEWCCQSLIHSAANRSPRAARDYSSHGLEATFCRRFCLSLFPFCPLFVAARLLISAPYSSLFSIFLFPTLDFFFIFCISLFAFCLLPVYLTCSPYLSFPPLFLFILLLCLFFYTY